MRGLVSGTRASLPVDAVLHRILKVQEVEGGGGKAVARLKEERATGMFPGEENQPIERGIAQATADATEVQPSTGLPFPHHHPCTTITETPEGPCRVWGDEVWRRGTCMDGLSLSRAR